VEIGQRKHYHQDMVDDLTKSTMPPENMVNPRPIEVANDQGIAVVTAILAGQIYVRN